MVLKDRLEREGRRGARSDSCYTVEDVRRFSEWADSAGVLPQSSVGQNFSSTASSRFVSKGKAKTRYSLYFKCNLNERGFSG